jgi:hypothetical protein
MQGTVKGPVLAVALGSGAAPRWQVRTCRDLRSSLPVSQQITCVGLRARCWEVWSRSVIGQLSTLVTVT